MYGEYGIYCDGTFVAVVCGDRLYVRPTRRLGYTSRFATLSAFS